MTEPNRQSGEKEERIIEIEIERLRPFKEHPFQVKDDKEMFLLQESIEKYGILNPLIVRPVPDGYYEIISGHRRKHAAEKLGYRKVPVIIRALSEDDSILSMVDSNLHRERISYSEKAFVSQIFLLCKEHGGCWFETIFDDFLIDLIKFLLAVFLCLILFLRDFSFSRSKKIYLVKSFLLAPIHDSFLKSVHEFICGTMLVSGGFFMWFIHIRLPFHCRFSHTVYYDMGMDISGFIYNLFPGFFIMFKQKIIDSSRVICISAFNVFYDCHSYHLPVSVPLFSIGISR